MIARRVTLLKQLDLLVTWLECGDEERPDLFGSRNEYEWLLRLAGITRSMLTRHHTDTDGRCGFCRQPRKEWQGWLPRRRAPCQVLARVNSFGTAALDQVWWQVLSMRGDDVRLKDVRAWLDSSPDDQAAPAKHARLITDERVRPYVWSELPTGRMLARPDEATTQKLPRFPRIRH